MYQIQTLNHISPKGLERLSANLFELDGEGCTPDGILVRSADMHAMELPTQLLAIARAGAGTNNIPVTECSQRGIVAVSYTHLVRHFYLLSSHSTKEVSAAAVLLPPRNVSLTRSDQLHSSMLR